jgi:hypothetical protein
MKWDPCLKVVDPPKVQFLPMELSEAQKVELAGYGILSFVMRGI